MSPSDLLVGDQLAESLSLWQAAAGPFWPYVCAAPFISSSPAAGASKLPAAFGRKEDLLGAIAELRGQRTAVFLDLLPERTLSLTHQLNCLGYVVVPVIQRWVTAHSLIRSRALVDSLIRFGSQVYLPGGGSWGPVRGAVFLLDGLRHGRSNPPRSGSTAGGGTASPAASAHARPGRQFDNRYSYPICRFPPPVLLRRLEFCGFATISGVPAPDLAPYYARLIAQDFVQTQLAVRPGVD